MTIINRRWDHHTQELINALAYGIDPHLTKRVYSFLSIQRERWACIASTYEPPFDADEGAARQTREAFLEKAFETNWLFIDWLWKNGI